MTSSKRQRTLFEFAISPSPKERSTRRRQNPIGSSSGDDDHRDLGRIQFEHGVNEVDEKPCPPSYMTAADTRGLSSSRSSTRTHGLQSSPVISVDSSSSEAEVTYRRRSARVRESNRQVVVSDESESHQPRKKRRLVKGKRPERLELDAEDEENLLEEVDEDTILDSRLRDRSKKSAFAYNLERLQRRRRGQATSSDSEEDDSESSGLGHLARSDVLAGARPTNIISDDDNNVDEDNSENEGDNDFIVEDGAAEDVPELPIMFSMGTFQDLSHHFKVICQLFVHLALTEAPRRRLFMEKALKQNYFSVPLAIMRRKLSGMRDSLVTSSAWKPEFKNPMETFPCFCLEQLDFSVPICDACHLGNRIATLRGVLSGHEYDPLTHEPRHAIENTEESNVMASWNLGRFCASRAQTFHMFTHWEHILYCTLRTEVDGLKEAAQHSVLGGKGKRVFIPATNGPGPPDDLNDADGMMDWLDGRGIINAQWAKIKTMMAHAHKLEVKGRGGDDAIEVE